MMPSKRPRSPSLVVTAAAQGEGHFLPQAPGHSSMSHIDPAGAESAAAASSSSRPIMSNDEIHRLLVTAIYDTGVQIASPSKIAEEMHLIAIGRYPMLKTENIKSHLQRYRKTQAKSKGTFLEDYDRFLERLQYLHSHNQRPGAFGMIDLQHVLGGKAAALVVHSAKGEALLGAIARPGGGREAGLKTKKKTLPKGDIHDYTFVHTKSLQSGINVAKLPLPQLTQAERNTPVGQSFLQILHLLNNMERFLLQKRGIRLPSPTLPSPAPVTVSLDTMRHSQQHPHPSFRGTSSSTANRSGGSMPPPLSRLKRRRRRNPDLDKLRRLLVGMSSLRQRRAKLQQKNPQVTFSVANSGDDAGMEDDSCSDSSSSSSSSFQGRNIPGRKGSLDSSTTLSTNTSFETKSSVLGSFQSSSTSRLEKAEWIFEGVPKPQDLKSGIFLDMDSSSSSLSTDEMDNTIEDRPDITQDIARLEAALQQRMVQRKRSASDVSVIDGSLYVADDGSIRTTIKGRLSRQSSESFVAPVLEDQTMNEDSRTFAPPSPSYEEMMSYMESALFQNDPDMTDVLAVDSNWNEFAGLSRSTSPPGGHKEKQPVCWPNMAAPYSSHMILPTNPTPNPLHMPLAKPPLLAESQAMPPTVAIPAQDSSFHPYHENADPSSAAVFEPPRTLLQRSANVGGWQEMPTPYNMPVGAQLHQHIRHEVFGRNAATGMPNTLVAGMLLPDQQTLHVPAIQNIPQPPQPYLEQASLSQQPTLHRRRPSQLGRFYPVEAFPGEGNGGEEDDPLH